MSTDHLKSPIESNSPEIALNQLKNGWDAFLSKYPTASGQIEKFLREAFKK